MFKIYSRVMTLVRTQNPVALKYLLASAIFEGMTMGILILQETVAKIQFTARDQQITAITVLMHGTFLFALVFSTILKGRVTMFLTISAILGRATLALFFMVESVWGFLLLLLLHYSMSSLQSPLMSEIMRRSFLPENRGKIYGLYRAVFLVSSALAATAAGFLFDLRLFTLPEWLRPGGLSGPLSISLMPVVFGCAGLAGCISFYYLILMCRGAGMDKETIPGPTGMSHWAEVIANKPFLRFEAVFMVYGMAFLSITPVIPIFVIDVLKFSYGDYSLARGLLTQVIIILLTPLAGALFDRIDFHRFVGGACVFLSVFPLCLGISDQLATRHFDRAATLTAYAGFSFFAIGLTIIGLAWSLAGLKFSGEGDSGPYQSFHVAMVGIRGILGPITGYLILRHFSYAGAFSFSFVLWVTAGVGMMLLSTYEKKQSPPRASAAISA